MCLKRVSPGGIETLSQKQKRSINLTKGAVCFKLSTNSSPRNHEIKIHYKGFLYEDYKDYADKVLRYRFCYAFSCYS